MDVKSIKYDMCRWLRYSPDDCEEMAKEISFSEIFNTTLTLSRIHRGMFLEQFSGVMFRAMDNKD